MKRGDIDILVQKYMAAESTRNEEAMLKAELLNDTTPNQYRDLKALFAYFDLQKSHTAIPEFQNPTITLHRHRGRIISMPWIAAAASIAIIVLAYIFFIPNSGSTSMDTFSDPEIAAQNAAQALELLSGELNKGRTLAMDQMKELDNLNKYLNIF